MSRAPTIRSQQDAGAWSSQSGLRFIVLFGVGSLFADTAGTPHRRQANMRNSVCFAHLRAGLSMLSRQCALVVATGILLAADRGCRQAHQLPEQLGGGPAPHDFFGVCSAAADTCVPMMRGILGVSPRRPWAPGVAWLAGRYDDWRLAGHYTDRNRRRATNPPLPASQQPSLPSPQCPPAAPRAHPGRQPNERRSVVR